MTADISNETRLITGLADRLWMRTETLHRQAERSGIFRDLLRGEADRGAYALLLRNLLPVYEALEGGLEALRASPVLGPLARRDLYRADALAADVRGLAGEDLAVLPSARRYVDRIRAASEGDGSRLVAHAYVRTLGDLNGGQILKRLLAKHLGLGDEQLAFYDFPADPGELARRYRAAVDVAGRAMGDGAMVLDEAAEAFRLNIGLSEEVRAAAHRPRLPSNGPALSA